MDILDLIDTGFPDPARLCPCGAPSLDGHHLCQRCKSSSTKGRERSRKRLARRVQLARERAHRMGAEGAFFASDVRALYRRQDGRCLYCAASLRTTGYEVDHKMPLSRGGSNDPGNLCLLCPACNADKGALTHHEYESKLEGE